MPQFKGSRVLHCSFPVWDLQFLQVAIEANWPDIAAVKDKRELVSSVTCVSIQKEIHLENDRETPKVYKSIN